MKTYISLFTLILISVVFLKKAQHVPTFKSYESKDGFVYSVTSVLQRNDVWMSMSQLPSTYQNKPYLIKEISSANNSVSITLELGMGGVLKNYSIRTFGLSKAVI